VCQFAGTGLARKGQRVIVPVTDRGDAIGLLELLLQATRDKGVQLPDRRW
jgi:hypothetical protein